MAKYQKEKITLHSCSLVDFVRFHPGFMLRYFLPLFVLFVFGCEHSPETFDHSTEYFRLKVGAYFIYDVDETQYNQITGDVQSQYELKVTISDSALNQEGGYSYIFLRQKRKAGDTQWENLPTWAARTNNRQAIVTEENVPYVKLIFPMGNGVEWNGNAYNTLGGDQSCDADAPCDLYVIQNFDSPFSPTEGTSFEHTATVIQNDNPDLIVKQDVRKEVYALDVGLIYKESTILNFCTQPNCLGKQIVETGVRYKQVIKEYGGL